MPEIPPLFSLNEEIGEYIETVLATKGYHYETTEDKLTIETLREAMKTLSDAPMKPNLYQDGPAMRDALGIPQRGTGRRSLPNEGEGATIPGMSNYQWGGAPIVIYDGTNAEQVLKALKFEEGDFVAMFPESSIICHANAIDQNSIKKISEDWRPDFK